MIFVKLVEKYVKLGHQFFCVNSLVGWWIWVDLCII